MASRRIDRVVAATAGRRPPGLRRGRPAPGRDQRPSPSSPSFPSPARPPAPHPGGRTSVSAPPVLAHPDAGKAEVKLILRGTPISVRDNASADVLTPSCSVTRPIVAADLAVSMPRPVVAAEDRLVVCLRPWAEASRRLVPVGMRRSHHLESWAVAGLAARPGFAVGRTGLAAPLGRAPADRDHPVREAVAGRMGSTVTFARPDLVALLPEVASGRVVVRCDTTAASAPYSAAARASWSVIHPKWRVWPETLGRRHDSLGLHRLP